MMAPFDKASFARTKRGLYQHILIATDGSELAAKGVEHGLALAEALIANVTVLRVLEPEAREIGDEALAGEPENAFIRRDPQVDDIMGKQFAWIEQEAVERGIHVELLREIDDVPAKAVLKAAKLTGCDLIVMASQGRQDPHRLTLNRQTEEVIAYTNVPVLVVQ